MDSINTRAIAARILAGVLRDKRSLTELFQQQIPSGLAGRDRALVKEYCYGVLRWYHRLKIIADALVYKPIKAREQEITALLLIGLYQLIHLNTKPYAAVSETVAAAQTLKKSWAKGLINQALHQFLNHPELFLQKADATVVGRYSHPQWLIDALKCAWPHHWENILSANNHAAPMFLRVNPQQNSREEYRQRLQAQGIESISIDGLPHALKLVQPQPVDRLPGFNEGCCSVQDLASQYIGALLDLQPEQRVLDACAAPGGKAGLILETAPVQLVAIDHDAERLTLIKHNLERLKLKPLQISAADVAHPATWWDEQLFDCILLDAPCSGTGVIRRHPDIKILRQAHDIVQTAEQQRVLLNALWPLLKPGGRLLYTTCAILPEENSELISSFCQAHLDARSLPIKMERGLSQKIGHQLFPTIDSHDGFYYALLTKTTSRIQTL